MRMVATARLRGAQAGVLGGRPYAQELQRIIGHLSRGLSDYEHPLLQRRPAEHSLLIVVTSDRGLCGAFNANVLRAARAHMSEMPGEKGLICVGKRGNVVLQREGFEIVQAHLDVFRRIDISHAQGIARDIAAKYAAAEVDRVDIVYNEFRSRLQQVPRVETLLPIPIDVGEDEEQDDSELIYEPSPAAILDALLPRQLETQVWRVLLESNASEQAARMNAMETAPKAADDMLDALTLERNRVRQTMITKEIAEIVGGAEALKSS
jgi:F-type H+-transporting ATPase subunit gamma